MAAVRLSLLVDDYDRAINFYCDLTGTFTLVANAAAGPDHRYVVLAYAKPKVPFELVLFRPTTPAMAALIGQQAGNVPLMILPVDDCLGLFHHLRQRGVRFLSEPLQLPNGCQATLVDPFGNKVCLSESFGT